MSRRILKCTRCGGDHSRFHCLVLCNSCNGDKRNCSCGSQSQPKRKRKAPAPQSNASNRKKAADREAEESDDRPSYQELDKLYNWCLFYEPHNAIDVSIEPYTSMCLSLCISSPSCTYKWWHVTIVSNGFWSVAVVFIQPHARTCFLTIISS